MEEGEKNINWKYALGLIILLILIALGLYSIQIQENENVVNVSDVIIDAEVLDNNTSEQVSEREIEEIITNETNITIEDIEINHS